MWLCSDPGSALHEGSRLPVPSQCPDSWSEWHEEKNQTTTAFQQPHSTQKKIYIWKGTSSREIRGCRNQPPLKGNFKTQDKKINKIFQLKRKKKKFSVCPHQCQVAILEECPKAGRGVRFVYEVQLSSLPVTVKLDSRTSWFMVTRGCRRGGGGVGWGGFSLVLLHRLLGGPSV